jgi:isopentenyl diphosphate isomerase/L-lactate dehydrogenase-like FMN-dependent dehydrogenase
MAFRRSSDRMLWGRGPDQGSLRAIAEAIDGKLKVILDNGIRRGANMMRAKALGADFVLTGRALAYGVGAGGAISAQRAMDILTLELLRALGQLGVASYSALDAIALFSAAATRR